MKRITGGSLLAGWLMLGAAHAQSVEVKDAWIRGTVPAQKVTGAFMEITGKSSVRLVGAASPAAGTVEIHNMTLTNGVMKMFAVDGIDVQAGKTLKLAPGGYHVMLIGLKQQMKPGDKVPLDLLLESADKKRETVSLQVEVRDLRQIIISGAISATARASADGAGWPRRPAASSSTCRPICRPRPKTSYKSSPRSKPRLAINRHRSYCWN